MVQRVVQLKVTNEADAVNSAIIVRREAAVNE
jgi:hypothetical protein